MEIYTTNAREAKIASLVFLFYHRFIKINESALDNKCKQIFVMVMISLIEFSNNCIHTRMNIPNNILS